MMLLAELYTSSEVVLIITVIGATAVSIITAWRTGATIKAEGEKTNNKVDSVAKEVSDVHTLTNSKSKEQDIKITDLQNQIKILIKVIAEGDKRAAVLHERNLQPIHASTAGTSDDPISVVLATPEIEAGGEVATKDDLDKALVAHDKKTGKKP